MQTWSESAKYYDYVTRLTAHFAERMVEMVEQEVVKGRFKGQINLLDVACGTGIVPISFLKNKALNLNMVAVDLAPQMVNIAEQKILELNATNVSTKVMDGQNLALDDSSFDVCTNLFGLIFFPDRPKGFREMLRVLKPNGLAIVGTWNSVKTIDIARAISKHFQSPPNPELDKVLSLSDQDLLQKEMTEAGFKNVSIETKTVQWRITDKAEFEQVLTNFPVFSYNYDKQKLAKDLPDILETIIPNYKQISEFELTSIAFLASGSK